MRFGKKLIGIITVLFLLAALLAAEKEQEPDGFLSVDVAYGDRTETIDCWNWEDDYYLYLPAGVDLRSMKLRFGETGSWTLNGRELADGMPCQAFPLKTPMTLAEAGEYAGTVTIFQSANVGAMFVETASGNMKHIHEQKGNEESGSLRLYTQSGALEHDGVILAINGRGNSTWNEEKKSYSLELVREADLLGMGSAEKWILISNSLDSSHLHNKIVYEFARDFGLEYSPECDWVDIYLNGEYVGLYLLSERNEVHPQRVDISRENSFLVSRDAYWRFDEQGKPYITTESKAALRIYHAGMPVEELQALWQSAENAILREDGIDPVTGKSWQEWIDVESWVRKYLVDEVFGNRDGTSLSQFYYYDGNDGTGKIYAGPAWDYDLSMDIREEDRQGSVQQFFANIPGVYGSKWPGALYRKEEFYAEILRMYESEFLPLLEHYQQTQIPSYAARITDAAAMDASRWGRKPTDESIREIEEFLVLRREFLDDVWLKGTHYCYVRATLETGSNLYFAVKPGSLLPRQLWYESDDPGYEYRWYNKDAGEYHELDTPVDADMNISIRYEQITPPEETAPAESTAQEIPLKTPTVSAQPGEKTETVQEEVPEIPEGERIPLSRLLPGAVFGLMLVLVLVVGIIRCFADRRKM